MTETLVHEGSSDSTQRELSNEYQHARVWMVFKKSLGSCASEESNHSIGIVNQNPLLCINIWDVIHINLIHKCILVLRK